MNRLKLLPTLFTKNIIKLSYIVCSTLFKVNPKKVTFSSSRYKELSGNLLYTKKEFQKQAPDYQLIESLHKLNGDLLGKIRYFLHIMKDSYHLATSKFFIIDDYHFSVYVITPRKGTEIIQLWHACGAFKKFGLSTLGKAFGPSLEYLHHIPIHSNYSRVYVSSKDVVPFYAEAFQMDTRKIYPLGVPRTDFFFQSYKKEQILHKFYSLYPHTNYKKLVLYAPTFRGRSLQQENFISPIDFQQLAKIVDEDMIFLIHLHPYMSAPIQKEYDYNNIVYVSDHFTVEDLLMVANVLITDYSSIIFDYSLLNKPAAFFVDDLDSYKKERDFYYDFESFVPGPIFKSTASLGKWLKNIQYDEERMQSFQRKFFDYTDGKASSRIVSHLLNR